MILTMNDIKTYSRACFEEAKGSHDWGHTERVRNLCMHIGMVEGADMEVLEIAAYLHDVGRTHQDRTKGAVCHAEKGSEMAASLLREYSISDERKANILHCIRTHRFRGNHQPATIEARSLFDSDKLDAIGAIGIGRAFLFAGELGAKLHNPGMEPEQSEPYSIEDTGYREFKLKLSKIKDRMLTSEGRRMALERHAFMEVFFERFLKEYEGEI